MLEKIIYMIIMTNIIAVIIIKMELLIILLCNNYNIITKIKFTYISLIYCNRKREYYSDLPPCICNFPFYPTSEKLNLYACSRI